MLLNAHVLLLLLFVQVAATVTAVLLVAMAAVAGQHLVMTGMVVDMALMQVGSVYGGKERLLCNSCYTTHSLSRKGGGGYGTDADRWCLVSWTVHRCTTAV
jgi:hypothetical protein